MISIEQLIQRLEAIHEEKNDQALEVSIDIFNRLRRNISGRNTLCLLYTSPSPRDQRGSRMPSSA